MISCTEFIPAYSELFGYIDDREGHDAVVAYWEYVADNYLHTLRELVQQHGLRGCWLYWTRALTEEAADFEIVLDEEAGEYRSTLYHCPSKSRLRECGHITPYYDYCGHCPVLYRRVLEPLGLHYEKDLSECHLARCSTVIRVMNAAGDADQ